MKKLYKSFNTILLLLTLLTFGVGNAWGAIGNTYYGYANAYAVTNGNLGNKGGGVYVSMQGNKPSRDSDYKDHDDSNNNGWHLTWSYYTLSAYFAAKEWDGYSFSGWYDAQTGGNQTSSKKAYSEDFRASSKNSSNPTTINRFARFTAIQYTITFNKQSGSNGTSSAKVHFDNNDFTVNPVVAPTRDGYTFGGYYTSTNGGGVQIVNASGAWQSNKTGYLDADGKWIKAENTTLYAKWTANTYSVHFDGNASTGGSMSNQSFTYDAANTLTKNAYTKTDVITFDSNGGSSVSSISKSATFTGWATSANGTKVYNDEQSVSNLSSTNNATVNLYAKWSQTNTITLPNSTKSGSVLAGWSDGTNNVGEAGDTYNVPLGGKTLTAIWIDKYTPSMTGANHSMEVGDEQTSAFTFEHTSSPVAHISITSISSINNGDGKVIEYDAANNKIIAHNAGVATIYFEQAETETIKYGKSATYTYTVTKKANTLAVASATYTKYVDEEISDVVTTKNNTTTDLTTTSDAGSVAYYDVNTNKIQIPNSEAEAFGSSKLVTIHILQAENYMYEAADKEVKVTVKKHENAVKVNNVANYSENVYYNDGLYVEFTSLNTNNPTAPYTVSPVSGTEFATYYDNENGQYIWTAPTPGTAVWTVTQAEDYKFVSASTTMTVNVVAAPASTGCYVLNAPNEQSLTTHINSTGGVQGESMELSGPGATLTFKAMKSAATAISGLYVQYSSDGSRWDDINDEALSLIPYTYIGGDFSFDISNLDVKYIRFEAKVGATYTKKIKDVRVTRKTFLSPSTTDLRLDKNGEVFIYSNETASASFTINWSCASGGNLNLSTNNDKFRVEPTVIENVDCNGGSTPVTVYYDAASADEVEAKLYISNSVYSTTVNLTGSAMLHNQTINWTTGVEVMEEGAEVTNAASAMTTVTYTSSDLSVISVSADGQTLTAVARGTATITATAAASGVYAQATDTKVFTVTDEKPQYILWNQSLVNLHVGDANVVLNATTTSSIDGCTTNGSRPITYTSDNEAVAKIVNGNELQIIGVGMATITATQAGGEDADGHNYIAVSKENKVVVTDPSVECVAFIPIETTSGTLFDLNTNKPQVQLDIELNPAVNGKPASVSFDTKTEKFAGIWLSGNLILAQKLNGEWIDVRNFGLPTEGSYDTYTDIELDQAATAIRFYRPAGGEGYVDLANISVKKARYIVASAEEYTITTKVGEAKPLSITVNYSNVVGPISCTLSGANPHFSIDQDAVVASCGDHGQFEIMVTYSPTAETNGETDVLTITDGQTTCTVDLTGQASLTTRTIVWSAPTAVYTLQTCTLAASCQTEYEMPAGEVKFRLLPSSTTGTLTNNVLSFDKAGVANIEAYVEEDYRFTMPSPVGASIEVIQTPTEITTLPTISNITVGMALDQITLSGGEAQNTIDNETVAGEISVIDGDLSAAGEQTITLQFTPDNTNMYAPCTRDVTVNVTAGPFVYTGNGLWTEDEKWNRGTTPSGSDEVIINGKVTVSGDVTVNSLTITEGSEVTLIVDGHLTINGDSKDADNYGDLFVMNGGEVDVNGTLKVRNLTVEASIGTADGTSMSGQIAKASRIAYANAYIEIHMDPTGTLDDTKWYGFTVPFEVNARTGVSRKEGKEYRNCSYSSDYIIAEYDAAKRLSTGKGWKYLVGNTLNAGQFYYFGANGTYNTYRFKAAESSYSAVTEKSLSMNGSGSDANWNAVGNFTLQHAKASYTGGSYVQVYQNGLEAYKTVPTSSTTFVVGCPFFIQASETSTLTLSEPMTKGATAYYAPRRSMADEENDAVCINFSSVDGGYSDPIYVSATDKEENTYILGRDLSKAGECKIVPQMWVNEYGKKLSVHEAAWQGNNAFCALGLYVPADGEYTLSAAQTEDNTQIYLTMDNQPIWNLTQSEYTVALEKGTSNAYGLMMVKAPAITTGVEQTQTSDVQESKVMIKGMLFILRNGEMFDAVGRKVK